MATLQQNVGFRTQKVRILSAYLTHLGLNENEIVTTCPCPQQKIGNQFMLNGTWVFSKKTKEPTLLVDSEFEFIND